MPNFTGSFKGRSLVQTIVSLHDTPGHDLVLRESVSTHKSSDAHFNGTTNTIWGTADLVRGHGHERGYFVNEHSNGDRDCGTYECKVSTVNGKITLEGTWKYTHGTGQFNGITGNGTFTGRLTSPTEAETSYEGDYQLKAGTRAA
jgi:hypothetical protein